MPPSYSPSALEQKKMLPRFSDLEEPGRHRPKKNGVAAIRAIGDLDKIRTVCRYGTVADR
jgi:hypothetical protein